MKRLIALAVVATALGLASNASAQSGFYPGWYVGGGAGPTIMQDPTGSFTPRNIVDPSFKAKMDLGFGVSLSAGYEGLFIPEFRVEGEINYHSNKVSSISSSFLPFPHSFGATGSFDTVGLMVNGYYDFLNSSAWTPYIGGGVGAGHVAATQIGIPSLSSFTASANDWQFAYQGIAGVRYSFTPNVSFSLDYRYFSTLDPKFTVNSPIGTVSGKAEYHTHNIMLGVAYHFLPPPPPPPVAAAPPPPPAPAPPPPARQFVVYFEFDKSDLTPEGAKVVQDAAAAYKQTGSARIAVTGYTDLAGTQKYNLGLSKRRADTVRGALVRQGVPDSAIAEAWRGKENPAVPTPDGVREPRNRRVEIML
jgi:OOP family OmpA-OmpF porin